MLQVSYSAGSTMHFVTCCHVRLAHKLFSGATVATQRRPDTHFPSWARMNQILACWWCKSLYDLFILCKFLPQVHCPDLHCDLQWHHGLSVWILLWENSIDQGKLNCFRLFSLCGSALVALQLARVERTSNYTRLGMGIDKILLIPMPLSILLIGLAL